MAINKKTNALFKLMERFLVQKEISSYDGALLDEFGCNHKTLERYLQEIESLYMHIITVKKVRQKVWRLVGVSDIFREFVQNSEDISQLFLMAHEFDPSIYKELERGTLAKIAKNDESIFLFKNSIMEDLQQKPGREIFRSLKDAIKHYEYRDIVYNHKEEILYKNAKCLKLLFMDNNWYLALIDAEQALHFVRVSFIQEVRCSSKKRYQKSNLTPYINFVARAQNSMTLYGVEPKIATIKATPHIARYFEPEMKQFLPSQKFKKRLDDGSILFTLEYTQELEILPFVQKWLPDLIILEPKELKEVFGKKLQSALQYYLN